MTKALDNIIKGLVLHFLHQGTVQDAVEQGRDAGVPQELLETLPAMMFDVTSAAGAVFVGGRELQDVLDQMSDHPAATKTETQVARKNIERLLQMALGFMKELSGNQGADITLPEMDAPWYEYGRTEHGQQSPGAYSSGAAGDPTGKAQE
jgi:hypothetical protein